MSRMIVSAAEPAAMPGAFTGTVRPGVDTPSARRAWPWPDSRDCASFSYGVGSTVMLGSLGFAALGCGRAFLLLWLFGVCALIFAFATDRLEDAAP